MATAHAIIAKIRRLCESEPTQEPMSKGLKGAIVSYLNKFFLTDIARKEALWYIFDATKEDVSKRVSTKSTHDLTEAQWNALRLWIDMFKDEEDNEWHASSTFIEDTHILTNAFEEKKIDLLRNGLLSPENFIGSESKSLVEEAVQMGGVVVSAWSEGMSEVAKVSDGHRSLGFRRRKSNA